MAPCSQTTKEGSHLLSLNPQSAHPRSFSTSVMLASLPSSSICSAVVVANRGMARAMILMNTSLLEVT